MLVANEPILFLNQRVPDRQKRGKSFPGDTLFDFTHLLQTLIPRGDTVRFLILNHG